jgi:hypothetical protein
MAIPRLNLPSISEMPPPTCDERHASPSLHYRPNETPALKAKALEATAKAIAEDAIGLAIEGQVANRIGLHCLRHYRKRGRAPDKLLLTF